MAELKEDGQVSCDTAHNPALNLFVHYATRPRRSPAARRRLDLLRLLLQLLCLVGSHGAAVNPRSAYHGCPREVRSPHEGGAHSQAPLLPMVNGHKVPLP